MAKASCRRAITAALEELSAANSALYFVATDSRGSVTASALAEQYPGRFIEAGIAEQNAVGIACGLALEGKTAFVMGPACFLAARSYEQIKVDVAYAYADVKIIGVSAGVSYGPLGSTHTSLHDFACMRALPNIEIFASSDAIQADAVARYLTRSGKPAYLRVGRGDVESIYAPGETFEMHWAKFPRCGDDITLIACGEMVHPALLAAERLAKSGISARVVDMFCLKPADDEAIIQSAQETGAILTIEEHSVHGGLGELVAGIVARHCPVPMAMLGFPDEVCKVGKSADLFSHYGLTPEHIADEARRLLKRRL